MSTTQRFLIAIAMVAMASLSLTAAGITGSMVLPSGFIRNHGQWPAHVIAGARTTSFDVYLTTTSMIFDRAVQGSPGEREATELRWTSPGPQAIAEMDGAATAVTSLRGQHRLSYDVGAHVYVRDLYPGVDLDCMIRDGKFRFDLVAEAGADLSKIGLTWHGRDGAYVDRERVQLGDVIMTNLAVLQAGARLDARFDVRGSATGEPVIVVDISAHDPSKPLVIDPIVYSSYMGGVEGDRIVAIRLQPNGNPVVVGNTTGMNFPPTAGKYRSSVRGVSDAYVAVMDKSLEQVLAYTYLGGGDEDQARGCHIDGEGNVYVVGSTKSTDFPTSVGAAGQVYKAQTDAFIAKLSPTLAELLVGCYLGGNRDDWANAVTSDVNGNIIVVGGTTSNANFPTNNGYQKTPGGLTDAFIARLSANGGAYQFSSFFGKAGNEQFLAVAVDPTGSPYVTGSTTSSNFETAPTPGRFSSNRVPYDRSFNGGNTDAFVIKFFSDGSLSSRDDGTYSTFFGGNGDDEGRSIFVDALGRAYIVGVTTSTNLEALGTLNTTNNGQKDIFMAVIAADGRDLQSNTYFGAEGNDEPLVAISGPGTSAVIGGVTVSNEFPNEGIGTTSERKGTTDAFLCILNTATNIHTTVLGGMGADSIVGLAVDANGDIYVAMNSSSTDLPTLDRSYDATSGDAGIGYVAKYAFGLLDLSAPRGGETYCLGQNVSLSWSVTDMPATEKFTVEYSADQGVTWTEIVRDITTRSHSWRPTGLTPQGGYLVRVRTQRGHVSVCPAPFTISAPPAIVQQPTAVQKCTGQAATLAVQATGNGLRYQWRRNGTPIQGATAATLNVEVGPMTIGKYDCVITGACTPTATSAAVDVSVAPVTTITAQPRSTTLEKGATLALSVTATGLDLAYQWEKDGTPIPGATASTYEVASVAEADAGTYRCVVTGGCGVVTSEAATIQVNVVNSVTDEAAFVKARILGPHPASDVVNVVLDASAAGCDVTIRDVRGQIAAAFGRRYGSVISLDVSALAEGTYVLELHTAGRHGHEVFVISR